MIVNGDKVEKIRLDHKGLNISFSCIFGHNDKFYSLDMLHINFEDLAEESLMIELGQMPNSFVLEQIYENNVLKDEQEEVQMFLNMCQAWSWA